MKLALEQLIKERSNPVLVFFFDKKKLPLCRILPDVDRFPWFLDHVKEDEILHPNIHLRFLKILLRFLKIYDGWEGAALVPSIGLKKVTFYNICLKKVTFGGPLPSSLVYTPTREIHMDDLESLCGPLNCFCMDFMHFYSIRNSFNQISNTLNSLPLVLAPWLDVDIQTVTFVCVYGRPSVRSPIIMRMYS